MIKCTCTHYFYSSKFAHVKRFMFRTTAWGECEQRSRCVGRSVVANTVGYEAVLYPTCAWPSSFLQAQSLHCEFTAHQPQSFPVCSSGRGNSACLRTAELLPLLKWMENAVLLEDIRRAIIDQVKDLSSPAIFILFLFFGSHQPWTIQWLFRLLRNPW